jgi:cytochrome c peroxidase
VDLVVLRDGRRALTANQASDSTSLIDLKDDKVLAEQACGRRPAAVACSRDGRCSAVSNLWSGTVSLFALESGALKPLGQVAVGPFPRGLVFSLDGSKLYAAVAGADQVVEINTKTHQILRRWPAAREPRELALSADGRYLAAASSRSAQVRCWDLSTGRLAWERTIEDGFNLRGLSFTCEDRWIVCAHAIRREFPVSKANIEQGWVIDSRISRFPLAAQATPPLEQLALDTKGQAVGDPCGVAFGADGRCLAVAASGTHELLLLDFPLVPWSPGDPGDFIDVTFRSDPRNFRRVPVGGRPLSAAFLPGSDQLVAVNALQDSVQVIDTRAGKLVRTIPLGPPPVPSLARRGEALFYDAQRSHNQWFSCSTCHVDGHTCGLTFDTLNDDSYGNPKLTPTLRNVTRTGPWTWHGWQKDLGASVEKSLTQTMFGPRPTFDEIQALLAFLKTIEHPPNPHLALGASLTDAARRGEAIFHGKARCARCHKGDDYTSEETYDLGLESDGSPYKRWNPPSLRGVYDRGPYLHDARAKTLDELLHKHHAPEMLGGQALAPAEREDLISFLNSL